MRVFDFGETRDRLVRQAIDKVFWAVLAVVAGLLFAFRSRALAFIQDFPLVALAVVVLLWLLSSAWLLWRIRRGREYHRERMLDFAKAGFVTYFGMAEWMEVHNRQAHARKTAESLIADLLRHMCGLVVEHVDTKRKGATFLVITVNAGDATFKLFSQYNHEHPDIPIEIETLTRDNSLAGRALVSGQVESLRDCGNVPASAKWEPTHTPPRYRGRAACPVFQVRGGKREPVGVVCFDVAKPVRLKQEDEEMIKAFAEMIGTISGLMIKPERKLATSGVETQLQKSRSGLAPSQAVRTSWTIGFWANWLVPICPNRL